MPNPDHQVFFFNEVHFEVSNSTSTMQANKILSIDQSKPLNLWAGIETLTYWKLATQVLMIEVKILPCYILNKGMSKCKLLPYVIQIFFHPKFLFDFSFFIYKRIYWLSNKIWTMRQFWFVKQLYQTQHKRLLRFRNLMIHFVLLVQRCNSLKLSYTEKIWQWRLPHV